MKALPLAIAVFIASCALYSACGDSSQATTAGGRCTESSACASSLSCIDISSTFVTSNDAGCSGATMHGLSVCTVACTGEADCTALSEGLVCSPNGCTTRGYCLPRSDAGAAMAGGHG
jgi:hypothetical protein